MATHAHTEVSLRRRRSYSSYVMPAFAALLVGLLLFWLVVNFVKGPSYFVTIAFIGLTNGALYALVALGYTLVYGILELINFAHGDVFMLGGLFSATMLLSVFHLKANASTLSLVAAILGSLIVAMAACGLLNAGIERVAYRPLRGAPRLAPLITAIGISFTFLIAGALAGTGGLVYALYFGQIRYDTGYQLGLIAFTAAVLGGIGNLPGAVLGALLIGFIQAFNEGLLWHAPGSDWTELIVFSILILILVFRPEGLLGERTPE